MAKKVIAIMVLFVVAAIGGAFIAYQLKAYVADTKVKAADTAATTVSEEQQLYDEAMLDLEDKAFSDCVEKLRKLRQSRKIPTEATEINELYFYAKANVAVNSGDIVASKEALQQIPDGYNGRYAQEIKALKSKVELAGKGDSAKAKTDTVAESQRILQAKRENISTRLSHQLALIESAKRSNKIQYDQSAITAFDYFSRSAQYDIDKAQTKMSFINEELEATKVAVFATEQEKSLAISTVQERKQQIQEELNYAYLQKDEVEQVHRAYASY